MNDYHSKYIAVYKSMLTLGKREELVMAVDYESAWTIAYARRREDEIVSKIEEWSE